MIAASQRSGSAVQVGDGKGVAAASKAPLRCRRKVSCASSPRISCSIPSKPPVAWQTAPKNHGRCSATSDEIVITIPTPWGDQKQSGVQTHLLCRASETSGEKGLLPYDAPALSLVDSVMHFQAVLGHVTRWAGLCWAGLQLGLGWAGLG